VYHGIHEKGMLDFTLQWQNGAETGKYISLLPVARDVTIPSKKSHQEEQHKLQLVNIFYHFNQIYLILRTVDGWNNPFNNS